MKANFEFKESMFYYKAGYSSMHNRKAPRGMIELEEVKSSRYKDSNGKEYFMAPDGSLRRMKSKKRRRK